MDRDKPGVLDFFAGSGLVGLALAPYFNLLWANDVCPKKAWVYEANFGLEKFHLASVTSINGRDLPQAALSWASFPCQDLSLAGKTGGLEASRSGLVWQWLRVTDEMQSRPRLLAAENVTGLVSKNQGQWYRTLHKAIASRGYRLGAMLLDAAIFLPQSRPRIFVVAVRKTATIPSSVLDSGPNWLHSKAIVRAAQGLDDWLWFKAPKPGPRVLKLSDLVDFKAPCFEEDKNRKILSLISPQHRLRLQNSDLLVVPGYKRVRNGRQVLELRFDETAGCLRTPQGGSSRQFLLIRREFSWQARLLTAQETLRLMGAPESFRLPQNYNQGYKAMGDAVATPVCSFLAEHILQPLAAEAES
ncbi:MAG: DNA cytosine methyltransferase [Deltaproteobacteria bacterium]|jgi:DNA (cytosine-5)-methyltransferase 1|nr:DNA cytosine methyltransferase [Deltaproteobacteria bacterium]